MVVPSRKSFLLVFLFLVASCSKNSNPSQGTITIQVSDGPNRTFAPLFNRIWRVSDSASTPAPGSIYIFLRNGTLLETSCVETYRIALWSVDQNHPDTLRVTEDQRPAFTVAWGQPSGNTLSLRQKLLLGHSDTRDLTLTAVDNEFVCPDLKK